MSAELDPVVLVGLRAALEAGASPTAALAEVPADSALGPTARAARVGQPLGEIAAHVDSGSPAADLLVRALGVAELTGTGAATAVEQALAAIREEAAVSRLLAVKTTQARGSAWVLSGLPVLVWLGLVAFDRAALSFYVTPPGVVTGVAAAVLVLAARWWSVRLVEGASTAAQAADPLVPARPRADLRVVSCLALPPLLVGGFLAGPVAGVLAAAVGALIGWWRTAGRTEEAAGGGGGPVRGGAADTVELVAIALEAGQSAVAAVAAVARLAPPAARPALGTAARRLQAGSTPVAAFADGGLAALGSVLAATQRWGAPAAPALRNLAADLRLERRAAAEQAAERVELALIFPTTLLTLPAFVLAVVPPLLWTAFSSSFG